MSYLRTLDPLKGLKGKLNFLRKQIEPITSIVKLANSITTNSNTAQNTKSSIDDLTLDQIEALANPTTKSVNQKQYYKAAFQIKVHANANPNLPIGTVLEQLDDHHKRLIKSTFKFTDKLSSQQLAYFNYCLRSKLNAVYPNWRNLHLNPDSPFRRELTVYPSLWSFYHLYGMRLSNKKQITTTIISTRKKVEEITAV